MRTLGPSLGLNEVELRSAPGAIIVAIAEAVIHQRQSRTVTSHTAEGSHQSLGYEGR